MGDTKNPLIGNVVQSVWLAVGGGAIKFVLEDGREIVARADGDCCSRTWIEEVQGVEQLVGATVTAVEDVDMPDLGHPGNRFDHYEEEMAYYGTKIVTDRGYALIDYRNSSNGYYGGNLVWPHDDYFYGGVFGQNGKMDDGWEELR